MASKLVQKLKAVLGDRLLVQGQESAWPLLCRLVVPDRQIDTAIYLAGVGPSGRQDRPFERRIQNPSGDCPIERHSGRLTLLVGLDAEVTGSPVLVAWDALRRRNKTTRYSAFVHKDDLESARAAGTATRTSTSGERIFAFLPDRLEWALSQILEETESMEQEELDYGGLSTSLANLSQGEHPVSFAKSPDPFESGDINWEDNWLIFVAEVQGWLFLDEEMTLNDGPEAAALQLFAGLGAESPPECFNVEAGLVRLTPIGHTLLETRVADAERRKEQFQANLDEDISLREASRQWQAAWEDEPDLGPGLRVNVHAEVAVWRVKDIKDEAESQKLELNPSYQRDIVWATSDSQKLIESMLRGIPLPSIILNRRKGSGVYEIVDGKQRLTAILRFIGRHPAGVRFAEEKSTQEAPLSLFRDNYKKWRKKLGIQGEDERRNCLPFMLGDFSSAKDDPLKSLSKKYYHEIMDSLITIQGQEVTVRDLFERTCDAYKVPVIIYRDTDLAQIHQVFGLYNRQGKQLNAEELRNAIYHHLGLTRLLLALSGDSERPGELVSFASEVDFAHVPRTLHQLQVGEARFHRTKLASWVASILVHTPKRAESGPMTPSTAGYINSMLDSVAKLKQQHPMSADANLKELAHVMIGGALLLNELRGEEEAFAPKFASKNGDGARWEDLPVVAAWTACTLAFIAGLQPKDAPTVADAVRRATERRPPLDKQQSRSQWGYIARTVLELLEAMGVDHGELERGIKQRLGYSYLSTLTEIDQLGIPLR